MTEAEELKPTIRFKRHEPIDDIKNDLLGFDKLVPQFVEELRATDPPYVIGLTGEWGTGKTSFLKCVKNEIGDSNEFEVVGPIELLKFSGRIDLSAALVSEVAEHFGLSSKVSEKLLDTLLELISSVSVGVGIPGGANLNARLPVKEIRKIWKRTKDEVRNKFGELIKKGLELRGKKEGSYAVILLDDLDRCLPDQALDLLEKLRLFFNSNEVIFVVALDDEVVSDAITACFGKDVNIDGHWYLEKLIDRMHRIPLPSSKQFQEFIKAKYRAFIQEDIPEELDKAIGKCWSKIYDSQTIGNPRRVLRAIERMIALLSRVEETQKSDVFLGFPLLLLREVYPNVYSFAKRDGDVIIQLSYSGESPSKARQDRLYMKHGGIVRDFAFKRAIVDICHAIRESLSIKYKSGGVDHQIESLALLFDRLG